MQRKIIFMKRFWLVLGMLALFGLSSCKQDEGSNILVSREFPTLSWERFDFVKRTLEVEKPVSYDLELEVAFDDSYAYPDFSMTFAVFDAAGNPMRAKDYRFVLKDRDGQWKSKLEEGLYHFRFPINNDLSINEPGTYIFQIENHMPITPLVGISEIKIINK